MLKLKIIDMRPNADNIQMEIGDLRISISHNDPGEGGTGHVTVSVERDHGEEVDREDLFYATVNQYAFDEEGIGRELEFEVKLGKPKGAHGPWGPPDEIRGSTQADYEAWARLTGSSHREDRALVVNAMRILGLSAPDYMPRQWEQRAWRLTNGGLVAGQIADRFFGEWLAKQTPEVQRRAKCWLFIAMHPVTEVRNLSLGIHSNANAVMPHINAQYLSTIALLDAGATPDVVREAEEFADNYGRTS